jgi:hypothetical protein
MILLQVATIADVHVILTLVLLVTFAFSREPGSNPRSHATMLAKSRSFTAPWLHGLFLHIITRPICHSAVSLTLSLGIKTYRNT